MRPAAPNTSGATRVSSRAGCSEPRPAPMKSISGRFELGGEQDGQQDGYGKHEQGGRRAGCQREQVGARGLDRPVRRQDAPGGERCEEVQAQQRHLVAAQNDQRGSDAGGGAVDDRSALQRPIQAEHGDRQIGEAQHLADVLDAPGHRRRRSRRPAPQSARRPSASPGRGTTASARRRRGTPWPAAWHRRPTGSGAGFSNASSRKGGEKIIDCGSAICGWPENT